jgi:hypothetical protein
LLSVVTPTEPTTKKGQSMQNRSKQPQVLECAADRRFGFCQQHHPDRTRAVSMTLPQPHRHLSKTELN